jgi:hypothetical protein
VPGFDLGQPYGHGRTQQSTIAPGLGVAAAAPAAGASYTFTCQPYDYWRLVFCYFELTTSATVANRLVTIQYPGVGAVNRSPDGASVLVTASTTSQPFIGQLHRGVSEWNTGTPVWFPLCGIWLQAGDQVKINVANIDTTDQLAKISMTFDRVPVDPILYGDENERARLLNELQEG